MRWWWWVLGPALASALHCQHCTGPDNCSKEREECGSEHNACYAVWGPSNTSDPWSKNKVLLKGCWHAQNAGQCEAGPLCTSRKASKHKNSVTYFCCCTRNSCNEFNRLQLEEEEATPGPDSIDPLPLETENWWVAVQILVPLLLLTILLVIGYWLWRRHRFDRRNGECTDLNGLDEMGKLTPLSGSGSLAHRPIQLLQVVARGRYGSVYEAMWGQRRVAVKVFPAQDVDSWMQEQDIYGITGLRNHENVLKFLCAEEWGPVGGSSPGQAEYWLVTEYHPRGSLCDYLKSTSVRETELFHIVLTMLRGLAFLHEEMEGRRDGDGGLRKPTIVHRDFKSKNVLLKSDLTACIADFGLAMRCTNGWTPQDTHEQVGTRRYMAPEVLEMATEFTAFAFRQIDVYAAALVMWECLSRTRFGEATSVEPYKLPFEEEAGAHPTLGDMQSLVVSGKRRPAIKQPWRDSTVGTLLVWTMEEMWDAEPEARITAGCAVERLANHASAGPNHPALAAYCAPEDTPLLHRPMERSGGEPPFPGVTTAVPPPSRPPDPALPV